MCLFRVRFVVVLVCWDNWTSTMHGLTNPHGLTKPHQQHTFFYLEKRSGLLVVSRWEGDKGGGLLIGL